MEERTNKSNTKGLVIAAGIVVVVGLAVVLSERGGNTDTVVPVPTATSSAPTVEDIFAMEPIIPQAKVSTEGWKTCRNEEYGYEFKFPAEWHIYGEDALGEPNLLGKRAFVRESEACNGANILLTPNLVQHGERAGTELYVEVNGMSNSAPNVQDYWREFWVARSDTPFTEAIIQRVWLDGFEGITRQSLESDMFTGLYNWAAFVYVPHREYFLHAQQVSSVDEMYALLSTFHFLDTSTSTTTFSE